MPLRHLHDPVALVLVALAVYRTTRLLVADELLVRPRAVLAHWRERGGRPGPLGYFVTCPWCVSVWVAAGWLLLLALAPLLMTLIIAAPLAWSAVAGLLASWE